MMRALKTFWAIALAAMPVSLAADDAATYDVCAELKTEIYSPEVPAAKHERIKSTMDVIARDLLRQGVAVETMRSAEVVIAVIPSDEVFVPNESDMLPGGTDIIRPYAEYLDPARGLKMLVAVHSDNTGSTVYSENLTLSRVNAIIDVLEAEDAEIERVIGFAMGQADPLTDNGNRKERAANRRIEIYLVPDSVLISK